MNAIEIKKALYKEKPTAKRLEVVSGFVWYSTEIEVGKLAFKIPENEAINFSEYEPAQLLIRWLHDGIGISFGKH